MDALRSDAKLGRLLDITGKTKELKYNCLETGCVCVLVCVCVCVCMLMSGCWRKEGMLSLEGALQKWCEWEFVWLCIAEWHVTGNIEMWRKKWEMWRKREKKKAASVKPARALGINLAVPDLNWKEKIILKILIFPNGSCLRTWTGLRQTSSVYPVANTFLFLCFRTKPEIVIHQRRNLYYDLIMYLVLSLS